jgi:hypothetical protein
MKYLMKRKSTLNTQPLASPFQIFRHITALLGVMILASWIHLPFAPVPWNLSFLATVLISTVVPLNVALCVVSLWILIGCYASHWMLPYMAHPSAPWGGYIWGMLFVAYFTSRCTHKKGRPVFLWLGALCILESVSALQYWRISAGLSLSYAKHTGLCALSPWHAFQGITGLSIGKYAQRVLRWMLNRLNGTQKTMSAPLKSGDSDKK